MNSSSAYIVTRITELSSVRYSNTGHNCTFFLSNIDREPLTLQNKFEVTVIISLSLSLYIYIYLSIYIYLDIIIMFVFSFLIGNQSFMNQSFTNIADRVFVK